jgi:transcriptional regulator with XRE-family HTH domain
MPMGEDSGSTVPRRQLGRHLRELREKSGATVQAAARALEWSTATLWRIETGQVAMRTHDVATMCRVYRASDDLTEALEALAGETKARGWWHAYGDAIPDWFELYVGLENAATRIRKYEPELIPGLVQVKSYSRAFIRIERPEMTVDEVDRAVAPQVAPSSAARPASTPAAQDRGAPLRDRATQPAAGPAIDVRSTSPPGRPGTRSAASVRAGAATGCGAESGIGRRPVRDAGLRRR